MTMIARSAASAPSSSETRGARKPDARNTTNAELSESAIVLIVAETGCSLRLASEAFVFAEGIVKGARRNIGYTYHPKEDEMDTEAYRIFVKVVPHGKPSAPGSAHEALERALLRDENNEYAIRHDRVSGRKGTKPSYCQVKVLIGSMRGGS